MERKEFYDLLRAGLSAHDGKDAARRYEALLHDYTDIWEGLRP